MATSALLAFAAPTAGARADEPFKPYVECLGAVRDCSKGATLPIKDGVVDMTVLGGQRDGKSGFYLFTPEDAYFREFPAPPPVVPVKAPPPPSLWNLYGVVTRLFYPPPPKPDPYVHYKMEPGVHEALYLAFKRGPENELLLEHASTAPGPSGTAYLAGTPVECHADAASRNLISQETVTRVKTVFAIYSSSPEPDKTDVSNEYNIVGHDNVRTFYNRDKCFKALSACLDVPELKQAALEEQAKFPK